MMVLLLPPSVLLRAAVAPPVRPNVLFIMADDLGWRDLGCFGSRFHQTSHLDRLAARGVRFTQAYAANPLCSPTRSSVLTGLWPARTGITAPACHLPRVVLDKQLVKGNPNTPVLVANSVTRLKTEYITLPEVLRDAGYRTGHFGKWHLGPEPYSPLQHGFDVDWPHWPGPGPAGSYVAPWRFPPALRIESRSGEHIEDAVSSRVVEFIRANRDRPFYVNYWPFSVHAPYDAKDQLVAKYRRLADPNNPQRNPVYAAMVESLDWMPTLLDMAGVPLPREAKPDGLSFASVLKGGTLARDAIFCHFPHDTPASGQHPGTSVRRGDWKLIRLHARNDDGTDRLELYNLHSDPGEMKNLAAEEPERARELNALITKLLVDTEAVVPVRNPGYRG
jgi:arylsulfatase A-like enzyme